jgi:hypothetical protein
MGVTHMVLVKVKGCDPRRTDDILQACQSQWKRKRHRDEMFRVDKCPSSGPGASLSIFVWVDLPGDALCGEAGDFVDRLAYAVWKANAGYCFVEVLAKYVHIIDGDYACYWDFMYEHLQTEDGKVADRDRKLAGIVLGTNRAPVEA